MDADGLSFMKEEEEIPKKNFMSNSKPFKEKVHKLNVELVFVGMYKYMDISIHIPSISII